MAGEYRRPDQGVSILRLIPNFDQIISRSRSFAAVVRSIEQVVTTDATVRLLGETGTGKGLPARALHIRAHGRIGRRSR